MLLQTARLRLREITPADADFMLELMNEPEFIANVADRGLRSTTDAERWIAEKILPSYRRHGFGFYIVESKETSVPLGICGLIKRDALDDVDIGYSILTRHSGNGYAYEAASALLAHARTVLCLPRVIGLTSPANKVSIHLLEKLGFRFERMVQLPEFNRQSMLFG